MPPVSIGLSLMYRLPFSRLKIRCTPTSEVSRFSWQKKCPPTELGAPSKEVSRFLLHQKFPPTEPGAPSSEVSRVLPHPKYPPMMPNCTGSRSSLMPYRSTHPATFTVPARYSPFPSLSWSSEFTLPWIVTAESRACITRSAVERTSHPAFEGARGRRSIGTRRGTRPAPRQRPLSASRRRCRATS